MNSFVLLTLESNTVSCRTFAVEVQEDCMKQATIEGVKGAVYSLAASAAVVLGAAKVSPAFKRSMNVSAKTALIVSIHFY